MAYVEEKIVLVREMLDQANLTIDDVDVFQRLRLARVGWQELTVDEKAVYKRRGQEKAKEKAKGIDFNKHAQMLNEVEELSADNDVKMDHDGSDDEW